MNMHAYNNDLHVLDQDEIEAVGSAISGGNNYGSAEMSGFAAEYGGNIFLKYMLVFATMSWVATAVQRCFRGYTRGSCLRFARQMRSRYEVGTYSYIFFDQMVASIMDTANSLPETISDLASGQFGPRRPDPPASNE